MPFMQPGTVLRPVVGNCLHNKVKDNVNKFPLLLLIEIRNDMITQSYFSNIQSAKIES